MKKFLAVLLTMAMLPISFISTNAAALGDVNGDGALTSADSSAVIDMILSNSQYNADADVDGNGKIDSADAAIILQKVLDSSYTMPAEPVDNTIRQAYTLTPDILTDNVYFEESGGHHASSNAEKIRITKTTGLAFTVAEGANVYINAKHASTSDPAIRTLNMYNSDNQIIAYHDYEMVEGSSQADPGVEVLFASNLPAGRYSLLASNHMNVYSVRVTFDQLGPDESTTETTTEYEQPMEITTTGNKIEVTDFAGLQSALTNRDVDIYVMNDIDCTASLRLQNPRAHVNIIGVTQPDGTSPSLNFASYSDNLRADPDESGTGLRVSGSYYNFENLIIENAANCGMRIKGTRAGHCLVKDCVFRYNNNSGISVTNGGEYNSFVGVDSYRNGDIVQGLGADADGFSIKVNAGDKNDFYNCRAWDNSDDGWDSYDKDVSLGYVGDISYVECLAWNNGKKQLFTGEYDYSVGNPLDKNLLYVKAILAEDPDFETKYNNKEVTQWPQISIKYLGKTVSYDDIYRKWAGNPNGFKFGSIETPVTSYRYIKNCIAFDNDSKGYDQNNAKATFDIEGGYSFDNGRNYIMGYMTAKSVVGTQIGFNSKNSDSTPEGMTITTPSEDEQNRIRTAVHAYRDNIIESLRGDIIPGVKLCEL